jgi:hypothetical protein
MVDDMARMLRGRYSKKGGGHGPQPSAIWAENTNITECTQESGHLQSMYSLICGLKFN